MAEYDTEAPKPTLPSSFSCDEDSIDELLEAYYKRLESFDLASGYSGFDGLMQIKLGINRYGPIGGLSSLDAMNQMLADIVTLWGLKWICSEEPINEFQPYTLEPDVFCRFGYLLTASGGGIELNSWSFFEGSFHGPAQIRKARDYLRAGTAGVKLIIVNNQAAKDKDRKLLKSEMLSNEVLAFVGEGGVHTDAFFM